MPVTLACWFKAASFTAVSHYLVEASADTGSPPSTLRLLANNGVVTAQAFTTGGSAGNAVVAGTAAVDTWTHACAVFTSLSSRAAYMDGGNKATNSTVISAQTLNLTSIGGFSSSSGVLANMAGEVAHVAIWNVALTDIEVAALGRGANPMTVRTSALLAYYPLMGAVAANGSAYTVTRILAASNTMEETAGIAITASASGPPIAPLFAGAHGWSGNKTYAATVLVPTDLATASPAFDAPALVHVILAQITDKLRDSGLGYVSSNADRIYICNAVPTTYAQATSTYALGYKNFGVGSVAGAPQAATGGRKIVTNAVVGGLVTAGGTPAAWAIVDTVNSLLLVTGPMSGAEALTTSDAWTLDAFGIGLAGALSGVALPSYDAATDAWESAVVTAGGTVSSGHKRKVDDLIAGLKADGVWTTKLDRLWLYAGESNPFSSLVDIVALQMATAVNSPALGNGGYTGNGANAFINSNVANNWGGGHFSRNDACFFAWNNTVGMDGGGLAGTGTATRTCSIFPEYTNTQCFGSLNWHDANFSFAFTNDPAPVGLYLMSNPGAGTAVFSINGVDQPGFSAFDTTALTADAFTALVALGGINWSIRQCSCLGFGGNLTSGERTALYNRLRTYMTAVGLP
jgi:Concanavalin A-like lectin/glucanases superfamily